MYLPSKQNDNTCAPVCCCRLNMVGTQGLRMRIIYIFIYLFSYLFIYFIYGTQGIYDAQHAYSEHVECKLNQGWCGGRGRVRVACRVSIWIGTLEWAVLKYICRVRVMHLHMCKLGFKLKRRDGGIGGGRSASPKAEWQCLSVLVCAVEYFTQGFCVLKVYIYNIYIYIYLFIY